MRLIRYRYPSSGEVHVGVCQDDRIAPLPGTGSLAELWSLPLAELRERLAGPPGSGELPLAAVDLLAPIDGRTEVWAAGVTYQRSREARVEESERAASVYELVYAAP